MTALSCAETPLAWPTSTPITTLNTSSTSGIHVYSPQAGSLQILTRRQQGVGDGVNIMESNTVAADFRGQRYSFEEAIFHTPGLHVFPGQTAVYPAEYHVCLETFSEPRRAITLVIPVSHRAVDTPREEGVAYWAACSAKPDPAVTRPTLSTLLVQGTEIVAYRGPDLRGRTADNPTPPSCTAPEERQFLLVLAPVRIRASDLERIPREGSLSTDPRDLPAKGISPTTAVTQDLLQRTAVLCIPGIKEAVAAEEKAAPPPSVETICKPIQIVDGKTIVDVNGKPVALRTVLGLDTGSSPPQSAQASIGLISPNDFMRGLLTFICVMVGLVIADYLVGRLWHLCMKPAAGASLDQWEPIKIFFFIAIASYSSRHTVRNA